jgi:hypothetical protein
MNYSLLQETGDYLLLEDGSHILLDNYLYFTIQKNLQYLLTTQFTYPIKQIDVIYKVITPNLQSLSTGYKIIKPYLQQKNILYRVSTQNLISLSSHYAVDYAFERLKQIPMVYKIGIGGYSYYYDYKSTDWDYTKNQKYNRFVLLETGDYALLENSAKIVLEGDRVTTGWSGYYGSNAGSWSYVYTPKSTSYSNKYSNQSTSWSDKY